jgi:hypothetical protein
MQPTISREERKIGDRQPERGYSRPAAKTSGGLLGNTYEGFLRMPVPVVLTALWLGGMVLVGSCVLMIYALGTLLAQAVAGV